MSPLAMAKRNARYADLMMQVNQASCDAAKLETLSKRSYDGVTEATLLLAEQVAKLRTAILLEQKYEVEREG